MIKLEISTLGEIECPLDSKIIKKTAKNIFKLLIKYPEVTENSPVFLRNKEKVNYNFELSFCDDPTIKEINKTYRNKDRETDVITFALFADDKNAIVFENTVELGEIIISNDTLIKQAKENQNTLEVELFTLITHGILHLIGFDHLTQKDYDFVVGVQNKVLGEL